MERASVGQDWAVEVEIRTAREEDLPVLREIFRRASLSNPGDRAALLAHSEALEFDGAGLSDGGTRVAVSAGSVLGFATTTSAADGLELVDLFVEPSRQRQGVGRRLVLDAVATARARGLDAVNVTANPHALDFYASVGFLGGETVPTEFGPGTRMRFPACSGRWSADADDPRTLEL
jgi:GNAT superfamily N-acetyltransferase